MGKVGASSPSPIKSKGSGNADDSVSGAGAPFCHAQQRDRGRHQELRKNSTAGTCDGEQQHALGMWKRMTGSESDFTVTPPLVKDGGLRGMDLVQANRSGGRWNRHSWGDGSGCHSSSAYGLLRCVPLHQPPPSPFPGVRPPAWCQAASVAAYPLSEDGLTSELLDFSCYLQLTSHEEAARVQLLNYVQACVAEMWGPCESGSRPGTTAQVMLYGSYVLGLSLPSSDIDLALTFPAEEEDDAARCSAEEGGGDRASAALAFLEKRHALHLERLHDLAVQLRKSGSFSTLEVEIYDQCRVPRIHLRDMTRGGASCDITASFVSARVACTVARQRLWLQDSPLAILLVRITKAAVRQWGLNEVFSGGLASTALYCMVLRFLAQMEQLCQHAQVEENFSPPRYQEATTTSVVALLSSSSHASSISLPQLSMLHSARGSLATPMPMPAETGSACRGSNALRAAAAVPSYVPSWALYSKKYGLCQPSSSSEVMKDNALCLSRVTACSLSHWDRGSSACQEDREGDDEVDGYTQTGLTLSSSAATTPAATPTPRTAACTPSSAASESHDGGAESVSGTVGRLMHVDTAALREGGFTNAEELTRLAQKRYGASPARLLLKLWRFLSDDAFVGGYQVADAFGDDLVWSNGGKQSSFEVLRTQLPSTPSLELATFVGRASTDLSAATFRLPELIALFRSSSTSLENMLLYQRYPRRAASTMLSTIFVDPRLPRTL